MDTKTKSRCVLRSSSNSNAYGGLAYACADCVSSYSSANYSARLAFKSEELAEYAGKQFLDIYADFV